MGYLTIEELKQGGVTSEILNCNDHVRIQFLIDYCSAIIDGYTGTDFYSYLNVTKIVDGEGKKTLPLPKRLYNLIEIKDVINNVVYTTAKLKSNNREIYCRDDIFDADIENIQIIGDWGWEAVPEKIKNVLISLCNRNFETLGDEEALKRITGPYKKEDIGDYSYELKTSFNLVTGNKIESTGDSTLDMILDDFKISDFDIGVI
jgi:hypothetical protein